MVPPGAFDAHCQNPVRMLSFKTLFRILLVLIVPTLLALGAIDQPLRVPGNPHGIESFEFCGWAAGFASVKFVMIGAALIVLLVGWWRVNKQN